MRYEAAPGLVFFFSPPCTAEILPLETTHTLPVRHALEQGTGLGSAHKPLYRWCARQTVRVDGATYPDATPVAWGDLDLVDRVEFLELALTTEQVGRYAMHMRDAVALPDEMVDAIEEIVYIQATGGCECLECRERGTNYRESMCRYHGLPREAHGYVNRHIHHRDEPTLMLPYEFTQIKGAIGRGMGRAARDRNPKTGKASTHDREEAHDLLRKSGINV